MGGIKCKRGRCGEPVLKHYREGTLARWLKAFKYEELAERVAEHRNAQLEGSKANLREVFGILEIPVEAEAFAEYCEKKLSKGFVFSDADGGDLKPYGQGVCVKERLLPFFPKEGKMAERLKEELAQWEVTEAELDEGNLLVELTCEKQNISVSFQVPEEDDRYQRIAKQLGRLVSAFNLVELACDVGSAPTESAAQSFAKLLRSINSERVFFKLK